MAEIEKAFYKPGYDKHVECSLFLFAATETDSFANLNERSEYNVMVHGRFTQKPHRVDWQGAA